MENTTVYYNYQHILERPVVCNLQSYLPNSIAKVLCLKALATGVSTKWQLGEQTGKKKRVHTCFFLLYWSTETYLLTRLLENQQSPKPNKWWYKTSMIKGLVCVVLSQRSAFILLLNCSKGVGRSFPGIWAGCLCPTAEKTHINAWASLVVFAKIAWPFDSPRLPVNCFFVVVPSPQIG